MRTAIIKPWTTRVSTSFVSARLPSTRSFATHALERRDVPLPPASSQVTTRSTIPAGGLGSLHRTDLKQQPSQANCARSPAASDRHRPRADRRLRVDISKNGIKLMTCRCAPPRSKSGRLPPSRKRCWRMPCRLPKEMPPSRLGHRARRRSRYALCSGIEALQTEMQADSAWCPRHDLALRARDIERVGDRAQNIAGKRKTSSRLTSSVIEQTRARFTRARGLRCVAKRAGVKERETAHPGSVICTSDT